MAKYLIVLIFLVLAVTPTDGGFFSSVGKAVKRVTSGVSKVAKGIVDRVKTTAGNFIGGVINVGRGVTCGLFSLWCPEQEVIVKNPTPPTVTCPSVESVYSPSEKEETVRVTWDDATAHDDEDGSIPTTNTSPYRSGQEFGAGVYHVTYRATDSQGSIGFCDFTFEVKVKECDRLYAPSQGSIRCDAGEILGSECEFSCFTGTELVGQSSVKCGSDSQWSGGTPKCTTIQCPDIQSTVLEHGQVKCPSGNSFKSLCSFICDSGYEADILHVICLETKQWSENVPTCRDVEPPKFTNCPDFLIVKNAERGMTSAVVDWDQLTADDNSQGPVTITLVEGSPSGSRFDSDLYHRVKYEATDSSGLTATCAFNVVVRVVSCNVAPLLGLRNGYADCDGYSYGNACAFVCERGYARTGSSETTCEITGQQGTWSDDIPTCGALSCPTIQPPLNGVFAGGMTCGDKFGDWCYFDCDSGYELDGISTRTCVADEGDDAGHWYPTATLECQEKSCPPFEWYKPSNAELLSSAPAGCSGDTPTYTTVCPYQCLEGYYLTGSDSMTCTADGRWHADVFPPTCHPITCDSSALPTPNNGIKNGCPNQEEVFGTTCTLHCNHGYQPSTPVQRVCKVATDGSANGVWTDGTNPAGTIECEVVTCPPPTVPVDGTVEGCTRDATLSQDYGHSCSFRCNEGYTGTGSYNRMCLASGVWDGIDIICTDETPPTLQCPADQLVFAEEGKTFAPILWEWEPLKGVDGGVAITATLHSINANQAFTKPSVLDEGAYILEYKVVDLSGHSSTCNFDIEVRVTRCPPLTPPVNGVVAMATGESGCNSAAYGQICEISCDEGYALDDDSNAQRKCERASATSTAGYWAGTQPQCQPNTCSVPTISNGYVSGCPGNEVDYRTVCQFNCDIGHQTVYGDTSVSRQCMADSSWSGAIPDCIVITCSPLPALINGSISPSECMGTQEVPFATTCQLGCNSGYVQTGPYSKQCLQSGQWSDPRTPKCEDREQPQFNDICPRYIDAYADSGMTSGTVTFEEPSANDNSGKVTVSRVDGHPGPGDTFNEGVTTVTYIAVDEQGNGAQCDVNVRINVLRCSRLPIPSSGSYDNCPGDSVYGSVCSVKCNRGYTLIGSASRTCDKTSESSVDWTGNDATCQIVTCDAMATPPNAIKSGCISEPPGTENFGTACHFYCQFGYRAVGQNRFLCQEDGTWSPGTFACEMATCPALTPSSGIGVSPDKCTTSPEYQDSCVYLCQTQGYQLQPRGYDLVTCSGNAQWLPATTNLSCVDIEAPRFLSCPDDVIAYADRGTTSTTVDWPAPVAEDNSGTVTMTSTLSPGTLAVGDHRVEYTATDGVGLEAKCSFDVTVTVRRCPQLQPPVFGLFVNDCDNAYGSTCTVTCQSGYELIGSPDATCEFVDGRGYWERPQQPSCRVVSCDPLTAPPNGGTSPSVCSGTVPPYYGTTCQYHCTGGFTAVGNTGPISCGDTGEWIGDVTPPVCEDNTAPTLDSCPGPKYGTVETGSPYVTFNWDVPSATDNSGGAPTVQVNPAGISPPHNFTQDTVITYTFTDAFGNSVECSFPIYIRDELAPEVEFCPPDENITSTDSNTVVTWEEPRFNLPSGNQHLEVTPPNYANGAAFTWGTYNIIYTATNSKNGRTATCSFTLQINPVPCDPLPPPSDGALTCDGWLVGGRFCNILCSDTHDIPRGSPTLFVCGSSGIWSAAPPDCVERRRPGQTSLLADIYYYSGDCNDPAVQQQMRENFITLLMNDVALTSDICTSWQDCSVDNVVVTCGPQSLKKKKKRATMTHRVHIQFRLVVNIVDEGDTTSEFSSLYDNSVTTLYGMMDKIEAAMTTGGLELADIDGIQFEVDQSSLSYGYDDLICDHGMIPLYYTLGCVGCPEGTHFNESLDDCVECSKGFYQEEYAKTFCKQCPNGTSTAETGARNVTKCLPTCDPGTLSSTGVIPCSRCPVGEYQPYSQATHCLPCLDGSTTLDAGSTSASDCRAICTAGTYSVDGLAPCNQCPRGSYQPSSFQRECIGCSDVSKTTRYLGSTLAVDCQEIDWCSEDPCMNGGTCHGNVEYYYCTCTAGFTGHDCDVNIDDCDPLPCVNGATCVDGVQSYSCECPPGFTGVDCFIDIDECDSQPCHNNATCRDRVNGYDCLCQQGYEGEHCETETDECKPEPCQNGGTCIDLLNEYLCTCADGYTGVRCQAKIDHCRAKPCANHGNCANGDNSYTCTCPSGYAGANCEVDLDLCQGGPCLNGGTCHDLGTFYRCTCPKGWVGDRCEQEYDSCSPNPCQNLGTCTRTSATAGDDSNGFRCACAAGFTGVNCEIDVDNCAEEPCSNDAECIDLVNGFECICTPGFIGDKCQEEVDECESGPCRNGGSCRNLVNAYKCSCLADFTGDNCEIAVSRCDANPCRNGGTCHEGDGNFTCTCSVGFTGYNCAFLLSACDDQPCLNEGTCSVAGDTYSCSCRSGYTGINCQTRVDWCEDDGTVCQNGGTCHNGVDSHSCECLPGFVGVNCEEDVAVCTPDLCLNGGICEDGRGLNYACHCAPGFAGKKCRINKNECLSSPCVNAMACTDLVNDYSCSCNDGWAGKNCDVNINDCEGVTCVGNAYCIDMINDYRCDCSPGFTGRNCETNIDECVDHACANGATCADEVNGYRCDCQSGWQGTLCQVNIDDCVANLCKNGATCVDELNGYQCACANGFEGQFCDVNIDDCEDHACQNAATCIDQVDRYSCRCPSGYEGPFCENEVDECEVYRPCENDAQCIDGINSYTCACAPGFRGSQCEININDCLPNPCKNGANCTDGTNDYFCDCQEGYTGKTCESDIDDCEDSQCENGATCTDLFNNYTCACAPGFTGIYCQTVMPSDFDLKFMSHGDADYVVLEDAVSKELTAFSLSVWIRTSTANTAIFSYHNGNATDLGDKTLSFENPADLKLYIGNEVLSTGTSVNDAKWHHVLVTWASQDGSWTLYRDGNLQGSGNSFQSGYVIPSGGTITLGQDRDFASANPSFVGDMHGLHLWDFALSGDLIRHTSYSCHSSIRGNVRAWPDFARGLVGTVLDVSPSVCDDFDECFSGPCEEDSTCIDELGSFSCVCPGGYTGKRCHINIDDCNGHLCQNGGRCVDGIMNYTCACANGFYGYYCEQEEIIARWQKWSPWSACSVTCGGGMRSRHRFCDVPPAEEEDVVDCVGSANETESCNIENCPECVQLRSPRHGVIRCEVNNTGEHECVIECDPGYEITDYVYSAYFCGPSTSYLWNHQTHQNPRADLPNCAEQLIPAVQKTDMMVRIPEYNCENSDDQTKVSTAVDAMLQENGEELYCLESGDCRIDGSPQIFNCQHQDRKKRRDATVDEGTYVSFALAFDIPEEFQSSVLPEGGENEDSFDMFAKALLLLYYAKDVMKNMTEDGMLAVTIDGTDYGLDPDTFYDANVFTCRPGSIASLAEFGHCVLCPVGTYYASQSCYPCDVGFYQEMEGQSSCVQCPNGMTTLQTGSTQLDHCYAIDGSSTPATDDGDEAEDDSWQLILIIVSAVVIVVALVAAILVIQLRSRRRGCFKVLNEPHVGDPEQKYQLVEKEGAPATGNEKLITSDRGASPIGSIPADVKSQADIVRRPSRVSITTISNPDLLKSSIEKPILPPIS